MTIMTNLTCETDSLEETVSWETVGSWTKDLKKDFGRVGEWLGSIGNGILQAVLTMLAIMLIFVISLLILFILIKCMVKR